MNNEKNAPDNQEWNSLFKSGSVITDQDLKKITGGYEPELITDEDNKIVYIVIQNDADTEAEFSRKKTDEINSLRERGFTFEYMDAAKWYPQAF